MDQKPNFLQALIAVFWAFLGIRKGKNSLVDQGVKPVHFVAAGLILAACFVLILNVIVRLVIRAAT